MLDGVINRDYDNTVLMADQCCHDSCVVITLSTYLMFNKPHMLIHTWYHAVILMHCVS